MINTEVETFKSPYVSRKGQTPLTRFLPLDSCVNTDIVSVHIPDHLQDFVTACHRACFDKAENRWNQAEVLKYIGQGKTLWQCGEIIRFGVRCHPVSRVFTQQLVRARIGVSYSQQCTGDVDCRHLDVIMPNSFGKSMAAGSSYIFNVLDAKKTYMSMVDMHDLSIQEARYVLPAGLASWIMMDISLGSLAELYNKRCCTMTQTWEMVQWARVLYSKIAVKAPWALPLFRGCGSGCWFSKTIATPFANTHLWAPDAAHDTCDWNPASFVHFDKTHKDVSSGPELPIGFYIGGDLIGQQEYEDTYKEYNVGST